MDDRERTDEALGIVRCARCGHRLNGEIECPFCSLLPDAPRRRGMSKWVFFTACLLTSPLSIYFILKSDRLNRIEKFIASLGCLIWFLIYLRSR